MDMNEKNGIHAFFKPAAKKEQAKKDLRALEEIVSPLELCPHSKPAGSQVLFDTDNEESDEDNSGMTAPAEEIHTYHLLNRKRSIRGDHIRPADERLLQMAEYGKAKDTKGRPREYDGSTKIFGGAIYASVHNHLYNFVKVQTSNNGKIERTISDQPSTWALVQEINLPKKLLPPVRQKRRHMKTNIKWTYEMKCLAVDKLYRTLPKGLIFNHIEAVWQPYVLPAVKYLQGESPSWKLLVAQLLTEWFRKFADNDFSHDALVDGRTLSNPGNQRSQIVPSALKAGIHDFSEPRMFCRLTEGRYCFHYCYM